MIDGYILVYRKMEDNPVLQCRKYDKMHAWIWMIMRANYKPVTISIDGKMVKLKRGQFHTSERQLASMFGWSREKVRRFLRDLEAEKMITTDGTRDGTTVTIEKYSTYQNPRTTNETTHKTTQTTNETTSSVEISKRSGKVDTTNETQKNKNKRTVAEPLWRGPLRDPNDPRYLDLPVPEAESLFGSEEEEREFRERHKKI